jgi:CheY-like chemotaxis protein
MMARILIVDDEPVVADTLALIFRASGYVAEAVYCGEDALNSIESNPPSLVITDVMMPGLNGVELAKLIQAAYPDCPILLFSGNTGAQGLLDAALRNGRSFEVLAKPVYPPELLTKVATLLSQNIAQA